MVGAAVQYTEPEPSNLASSWEMKSPKINKLMPSKMSNEQFKNIL
jgi:hypothetical protein